MDTFDTITEVGRLFSPEIAKNVIGMLRQDPLVWAAVEDPSLFSRLVSKAGSELTAWIPAEIAQLCIGEEKAPMEVPKDLLIPLGERLRQQAIYFYEQTLQTGQPPQSLREAGLLALALRERRRLTKGWSGIAKELNSSHRNNFLSVIATWRSPMVCLYGMIPDSQVLFQELVSPGNEELFPLVCHVLLANVPNLGDLIREFIAWLGKLPLRRQLEWLKWIKLQGREDLVVKLAAQLLGKLTRPLHAPRIAPERLSPEELLLKIADDQHLAGLYWLANRPETSLVYLNAAKDLIAYWIDGLKIQALFVNNKEDTDVPWSDNLDGVLPSSEALRNELSLSIKNRYFLEHLIPYSEILSTNPWVRIHQAKSLISLQPVQAREIAQEAVKDILAKASFYHLSEPELQFVFSWEPAYFIEALVQIGLLDEAYQCGIFLIENHPLDCSLIEQIAEICTQKGNYMRAIHYTRLLLLLNADHADYHRKLANLWEVSGEWENAIPERERVIKLSEKPAKGDYHALLRAAFYSNRYPQVQDICNLLLIDDENDARAYAYLGRLFMKTGQWGSAIENLNRATALDPDESEAWLLLAESYKQTGEDQRRIETLRKAAITVPASPDVNFALARTYLERQSLSEALPFLRKAASLNPESSQITLDLVGTLYSLGYLDEAGTVLERARKLWSQDPHLAFIHAKVLIAKGEPESAISAMQIAINVEQPSLEQLALYADILLGDHWDIFNEAVPQDSDRIQNAQYALEIADNLYPNNSRVMLLLAEILEVKSEHQQAFNLYHQLTESPEFASSSWRWRVQGGLGKASIGLGNIETGVAALIEASCSRPDQIGLQKLLADSYMQAELFKEALTVARNVLKLGPDQPTTLIWFAELTDRVGEKAEAISALQLATQLVPACVDNWLFLVELQLQVGDQSAARLSLQSLLQQANLEIHHLRKAAYCYLRLEDALAALSCLEKAIEISSDPEVDLLVETSSLMFHIGNPESALDILQKAIARAPDLAGLLIFEADILAVLDRTQAALACLEHALRVVESRQDESLQDLTKIWHTTFTRNSISEAWFNSLPSVPGIHVRLGILLRRIGNLPLALYHFEYVLENCSGDLAVRYLAVDLALALIQPERAIRLLGQLDLVLMPNRQDGDQLSDLRIDAWIGLAATEFDLAMNELSTVAAVEVFNQKLAKFSDHPRVMATKARMLACQGDIFSAAAIFDQVFAQLTENRYLSCLDELQFSSISNKDHIEHVHSYKIWLATAALDVQRWNEARYLALEYCGQNAGEPRAYLTLAKIIAITAERQRWCDELECVNHAPGCDVLSEETYNLFNQAIKKLAQLSNSNEVRRWNCRGQLAFHPSTHILKEIMSEVLQNDDIAPVRMALRHLGENDQVDLQSMPESKNSSAVMLQHALSLQDENPTQGLELIKRIVDLSPQDPIAHVVMGKLAEAEGNLNLALQSLEKALSIWNNEPKWQSWAARLATNLGSLISAKGYWEQAVESDPSNHDYDVILAKLYLELGEHDQALNILSRYCMNLPDKVEGWLNLARAYRQIGSPAEAMEHALQAWKVAPGSLEPLLLCAGIAHDMGDDSQALFFIKKASEINPLSEEVVLQTTQILCSQKRYEDALLEIQQFANKSKLSADMLYQQASLVYKVQGAQPALLILEKLAKQEPLRVDVLVLLANLQFEIGDYDGAQRTSLLGLSQDSKEPALNLLMGKLQYHAGQLDQAIHFFSETIRQDPHYIEAYLELGKTYQERREYSQALRTYHQAIQAMPEDYKPYYAAAMVMRDQRDFNGAENMLRKAARLAPDDTRIRRQLSGLIALNLVHNAEEATVTL